MILSMTSKRITERFNELVCAALIWAIVVAAVFVLTGCSAARAADPSEEFDIGEVPYTVTPGMKCPIGFAHMMEASAESMKNRPGREFPTRSYSRCTDARCERGYTSGKEVRVFEVLVDGVPIRHRMCFFTPPENAGTWCLDYDRGVDITYYSPEFQAKNPGAPPAEIKPISGDCNDTSYRGYLHLKRNPTAEDIQADIAQRQEHERILQKLRDKGLLPRGAR